MKRVYPIPLEKLDVGDIFRYIGGGDNWYKLEEKQLPDYIKYVPEGGGNSSLYNRKLSPNMKIEYREPLNL